MKKAEMQALADLDQDAISKQVEEIYSPKKTVVKTEKKSNALLAEEAAAVVQMCRDHIGFKILHEEIQKRYQYLETQLMIVGDMEKVNKIRAEMTGIMTVGTLVEHIIQRGREAAIRHVKEQEEAAEPRDF